MPKGPQGQWRPKGTIPCAMHVGKIATGEVEETTQAPAQGTPEANKKRARKGGLARAGSLTPERRHEIAINASAARWRPS